jgi:MFS family permease
MPVLMEAFQLNLSQAGTLMRTPPSLASSQELGHAGPTGDAPPGLRAALANRNIWLLALEFGCLNLVFMGFGTFFPTFLTEERGYSLAQAASIARLSTIVVLGSAPLARWLSDRIGSRRLVFAIPFLVVAGMMSLPFTLTGWTLYAFMILLGLVAGAVPTATFAAAPEVMGNPRLAGIGLAVVALGQNLGMVIGPILFGMLVETMDWAAAGYCLIPVCILGFVAGWMVKVR